MKVYIVDSFTREKFKGNPADVCLLDQLIDDKQMLSIASENRYQSPSNLLQEREVWKLKY